MINRLAPARGTIGRGSKKRLHRLVVEGLGPADNHGSPILGRCPDRLSFVFDLGFDEEQELLSESKIYQRLRSASISQVRSQIMDLLRSGHRQKHFQIHITKIKSRRTWSSRWRIPLTSTRLPSPRPPPRAWSPFFERCETAPFRSRVVISSPRRFREMRG